MSALFLGKLANELTRLFIPVANCKIPAGFPSPADDYIECVLDLNEHLVARKSATFFWKAKGRSMEDIGIFDGDLLIVDRSVTPTNGQVVIACIDGDFTVKRLRTLGGKVWLQAESKDFPTIIPGEEQDFFIWGIVTSSIRWHS